MSPERRQYFFEIKDFSVHLLKQLILLVLGLSSEKNVLSLVSRQKNKLLLGFVVIVTSLVILRQSEERLLAQIYNNSLNLKLSNMHNLY